MQAAIGLALMAALGAAGCKKNGAAGVPAAGSARAPGSAAAVGSGEVAAGAGSAGVAVASGSVASGGSAGSAAPFDAKAALDAALKEKGITDKDVTKRATGAHSAWALFASKTQDNMVMAYTVMEASAQGVAELRIAARGGGDNPGLSKDVDTFDVRDLDGDGRDECLTVVAWQLDHSVSYKRGCKKCIYGVGEIGKELYIIAADDAGALKVPFEHIVEYSTLGQAGPTDPDPPPPKKIAYDWKVDGKPPVVTLTRTEYTVNAKRPKELVDPATGDDFMGGSGSAVPLDLK